MAEEVLRPRMRTFRKKYEPEHSKTVKEEAKANLLKRDYELINERV